MKTIKNCPLCGSNKKRKFYEGVDLYYSKKRISYDICSHCSLIYLNPRLDKEEYEEMYKSVFQDKRRKLSTLDQAIQRLKRKKSYEVKKGEIKYFKDYINKDSKCLEIAGGWGTLAKVMSDKFKCFIKIIEPSKLATQVIRKYYHLDSFEGEFEKYIEQENFLTYDFVYSYYFLEHVIDLNNFFKNIKKVLKKDGKLLLAIPDVLNPYRPSESFFHIEHTFYFTPKTLELILNKHGFKVLKLFRTKYDMKVVCKYDDIMKQLEFEDFKNDEYKKIKRIINNYDRKILFFRKIKNGLYKYINKNNQKKISRVIAKILTNLRIIKG